MSAVMEGRPAAVPFADLSDEDLVDRARLPDDLAMDSLLRRFSPVVRSRIRSYYLVGADRDDLFQEGMLGLYKAVRDFDRSKLASFRPFAELCITRRIITAIKAATRQKHAPLNLSLSMDVLLDAEDDRTLLDLLPAPYAPDPSEVYESKLRSQLLLAGIYRDLTDLESQVLRFYLLGLTYRQTASLLRVRAKTVDNALQRSKRKIGKAIEEP